VGRQLFKFGGILFCTLLIFGCAGLNTNLNSPMKSTLIGKRVVVFPFQDPYYRGHQIHGVGSPFATVFVSKLQSAGVLSDLTKGNDFLTTVPIDSKRACTYALNNGYNMLVTGTVTEWVDGATQWSGTVDVAALTVNVLSSDTCEIVGSASGRQNGRWFTFVNAPTTRFFEPLSDSIVSSLLGLGK
jgi:hypothetical protein